MRFCLALAAQNERHWLDLYLPLHSQANVDGIVALDGGSSDGSGDILADYGAQVLERPFDWNFAEHINFLIYGCEILGYDALLWLSPDENMFPAEIDLVREELEAGAELMSLARVNFEEDRAQWMPALYPDYQWRAFQLGKGVMKSGRVHETVPPKIRDRLNTKISRAQIYHYEGIRADFAERDYKHQCYAAIRDGVDPFKIKRRKQMPKGWKPVWRAREPYLPKQPLDPAEIGALAPFEDDDI